MNTNKIGNTLNSIRLGKLGKTGVISIRVILLLSMPSVFASTQVKAETTTTLALHAQGHQILDNNPV